MINLIVAFDRNQLIGKDNMLPWHYKEDLKYFKSITLNKTVLFGKNTFYSVLEQNKNKILKNRKTIVLSFDKIDVESVVTFYDVESVIEHYKESSEELFICGGATIYKLFLDYCDKLYITHIDKEYEGDTYFPQIDYKKYNLISKTDVDCLSMCVYELKN